jgi:hypothetical protein
MQSAVPYGTGVVTEGVPPLFSPNPTQVSRHSGIGSPANTLLVALDLLLVLVQVF